MDPSSMKSLLELQAMQNLNTSNQSNPSILSSSNSTLFSDLMSDLLNGQAKSSLNGLGDIGSLQQALDSTPSTNPAPQNASANNYIASFMLHHSTNLTDLKSTANKLLANEQPKKLDHYTTDYTRQTDIRNLLAGAENYRTEIAAAAKKYNLPEKLITAVMKQESNFNSSAVSSAGASGLMQLMPATARYLGVEDRFDPEQNIMGGAKYLRQMLDQFDNNIETALAAYNAGPGNVKKYGGIPPFKETQNYVKNVTNYLKI